MAKIGDYIHYHVQNYRELGLAYNEAEKDSSNLTYNFANKKRQIVENIQKYPKRKILSKFEKDINKLFGNSRDKKTNANEEKNIKLIWEKAEQRLMKEYNTAFEKINRETGDIEKIKTADIQQAIDGSLSKISVKKDQKTVEVATLNKRLQSLEHFLNTGVFGIKKQQELQDSLDSIHADILAAQEIMMKDENFKDISEVKYINLKNGEAIIKQINDLISIYVRVPDLNLQKGSLFEFLLAYVQGVGKKNLQDSFFETFDKSVKGGNRVDVLLDPSFFSDDIDFSSLSKKNVEIGSKTYLSLGTSQQKIDVEITSEKRNVEPLKISAKNVNLFSGYDVHLVEATPLLTLIQNENADFINHYLNIIAEHPKDSEKDDLAQIGSAHETMKVLLLYKALSGDILGRDAANVFVYNNNKTGQTKVVDIGEMVKSAIKDVNNFSVTAGGNDLSSVRFSNQFVQGESFKDMSAARARAANLVLSLHQYKIVVGLKPSFLLSKFDK